MLKYMLIMVKRESDLPINLPEKGLFTHELVPLQHREHLFHFDNKSNPLPNYYIRDLRWCLAALGQEGQSVQEIHETTITLLSDLQQHDVQIAPYYLQEGRDSSGKDTVYLLTRDLQSTNAANIPYSQLSIDQQTHLMQKFNNLITNLTCYYSDCVKNNRPLLSDIAQLHQYVYAPNPPAQYPDFVLVDLEPLQAKPQDLESIDSIIHRLAVMIGGKMQEAGPSHDLTPSRHALASLIDIVINNHELQNETELDILHSLDDLRKAIA